MKTELMMNLAGLWIIVAASLSVTAAESNVSLPGGLVPVPGARVNTVTRLPVNTVHEASGIELVLIPAGEFQMGSPEDEAERLPSERQRRRIIRSPFYLGRTEVTVGQFRRFTEATGYQTDAQSGVQENDNPRRGAFASTPDGDRTWSAEANWRNPFPLLSDYSMQDDHPVVQVSLNDARQFTRHYGLQLPTEAQWEYAVRAGTRSRFFWGEAAAGGEGFGNFQDASGRRRFERWNSSFPFDDGTVLLSAVGRYRPNPWGLYDLTGNVSEWTADAFHKDYPADGTDETAALGGANAARVIRGSSWLDAPEFSRSARRIGFQAAGRRNFIGFRVVMNLETRDRQTGNPP